MYTWVSNERRSGHADTSAYRYEKSSADMARVDQVVIGGDSVLSVCCLRIHTDDLLDAALKSGRLSNLDVSWS